MDAKDILYDLNKIIAEVDKIIIDKSVHKKILLLALICEGHVLIEGVPGTAKTLLARSFAKAIGGVYKRIQFNSDTLPSDIIGFFLYTPAGRGEFIKGPVFSNILLADELNRAPARTQSALLEAMQEYTVTVEGVSNILPKPFMVIASQLPYGAVGTNPLTEVQLDRFMFRLWSGYNPSNVEEDVLKNIDYIDSFPIESVASLDTIFKAIDLVKKVRVEESIVKYVVLLVDKIRSYPEVLTGPSTRGVISLYKGSRAHAFLDNRSYVIPDDIKYLVHYSLDHRIRLRAEVELEGLSPMELVDRAVKEVSVPR